MASKPPKRANRATKDKPSFKVFLSHRYKSPAVNQQVFELLSAHADIRFEVDVGTKATNVTRLERFVRDADAFVGVYPFPSDSDARPSREAALEASRYFRLELDLAVRSRRPAIVFMDARYGDVISVPKRVAGCRYDHREAVEHSRFIGQRFGHVAETFCASVAASLRTMSEVGVAGDGDRVGILLPQEQDSEDGYSERQIARLEERLRQRSLTPVRMGSKAVVDGPFLQQLESIDWAVVDIGPQACSGGLPAFLHGHFVPQMRLLRSTTSLADSRSPMERTLLASFEVGYPKDIVRWSDDETLDRLFEERLATLYEPRRHIANEDEARAYFASAALRNEPVFLSYSGADEDFAAGVARALRERFQQVFDYRDEGTSIVPGRRWIDEVFEKLSSSAIGVPLLSEAYLKSGNCVHEAQEMMSLVDNAKLRVIPIKIREGPLDLPSWMRATQYIRGWDYKTPKALVDKIVAAYDAAPQLSSNTP